MMDWVQLLCQPSASEKLRDFLRDLPYGQRYELRCHDPPTKEGYEYTVQLVGPPAMVDGEFVGWDELRRQSGKP